MAAVPLDFSALANTAAWTPLQDLSSTWTLVAENVVRVGDGMYVHTVDHDRALVLGHAAAPFVTLAYWAPSVGAALRLSRGMVEKDDGISSPLYPSGLLPAGTTWTYQGILTAARQMGKSIMEHAEYNRHGRFIHRLISVDNVSLAFRGRGPGPEERPYGIIVRLK